MTSTVVPSAQRGKVSTLTCLFQQKYILSMMSSNCILSCQIHIWFSIVNKAFLYD